MSSFQPSVPAPTLAGFDALLFAPDISPRSLLELAWLFGLEARSCEQDGDAELGLLLRQDAARSRVRAVNQ